MTARKDDRHWATLSCVPLLPLPPSQSVARTACYHLPTSQPHTAFASLAEDLVHSSHPSSILGELPHSSRDLIILPQASWRKIPIALIEAEKGEAKAQTCDMAWLRQLSICSRVTP